MRRCHFMTSPENRRSAMGLDPRRALPGAALALFVAGFVAGCTIVAQPGPVGSGSYGPPPGLEPGTNRRGSDYRNFDLPVPRPEDCQSACMNEPQCVAFTYVNPGVQGPNPRCWLKDNVPAPQADDCCVSGTKAAGGPPPSAWQGAPPPPSNAPPPSAWQGTPPPPPNAPPLSAWQGAPPSNAPPPSAWQGTPPPPPRGGFEPGIDRPGGDYRSFNLPAPRPEMCREACFGDMQCRAFTYVNPGVQASEARCWLKSVVPPAHSNGCCVSGVK
jgi:PAN domain